MKDSVGKVFTPEEVAERLSVSTKTIKDWLRTGKLKGVKVGRLWRVRESELEKFLERGKKKKVAGPLLRRGK
jgi:excisionase family DNA binding protein